MKMAFNSILSSGMKCPYCKKLINTSLEKAHKTEKTAYCYFCDKTVNLPEHLIEHPEEPVIRYLGYFVGATYEGFGNHVATHARFEKHNLINLNEINSVYSKLAWHKSLDEVESLASRNNTSPRKTDHHMHQFYAQGYLVKLKAKEVISTYGNPIQCRTPEENWEIWRKRNNG